MLPPPRFLPQGPEKRPLTSELAMPVTLPGPVFSPRNGADAHRAQEVPSETLRLPALSVNKPVTG